MIGESITEDRHVEPVDLNKVLEALESNFPNGGRIKVMALMEILRDNEPIPHGIEDLSLTLYQLQEQGKIKIIEKSKLNGYPITFDYK